MLPQIARVESVRVDPLGASDGINAQLALLSLTYHPTPVDAPATMVAKLPHRSPSVRERLTQQGSYAREIRFYRDLSARSAMPIPRHYYADLDQKSGDTLLLLEDLRDAQVGDNLRGVSDAQVIIAMESIAKLHRFWWQSPRLAELTWVSALIPDPDSYQTNAMELWARFLQKFGAQVPLALREIGEDLKRLALTVAQGLLAGPQTLIHNDFKADNLFFKNDRTETRITVIDWGAIALGNPLIDVAFFLARSCSPQQRRSLENAALSAYVTQLVERDGVAYDLDRCTLDYRFALGHVLTRSTRVWSAMDISNERTQAVVERGVENLTAAFVDNRVLELR